VGIRGPDKGDPGNGLDLGTAGASARAEFERRRACDDIRRRQRFGRLLASLVKGITGEAPSTRAWERGGHGEERVGAFLSRALRASGVILHDRSIPGSRANIDHIAIVPSGVWIIDTKRYSGRVERRHVGGWFNRQPALFVNGRNRTDLLSGIARQGRTVAQVTGASPPLRSVLCFVDAEWGLLTRSVTIDDVIVTSMRPLAATLHSRGPLNDTSIRSLAQRISVAFPSYNTSLGKRPCAP